MKKMRKTCDQCANFLRKQKGDCSNCAHYLASRRFSNSGLCNLVLMVEREERRDIDWDDWVDYCDWVFWPGHGVIGE